MITTHSPELLNNKGIGSKEVAMVKPQSEGSVVRLAESMLDIRKLMASGITAAEAVIPRTAPSKDTDQIPFSLSY